MKPVLFSLGSIDVTSLRRQQGAGRAGRRLARELQRRGHDRELAYPLTMAGALAGFAGAKLYYLAENADSLTAMDFGGMGFTWYGGMIGGAIAVALMARRHAIAAAAMAGMAAIPLAVAYEALVAFAIALLLWRLRDRLAPAALFGRSGAQRVRT